MKRAPPKGSKKGTGKTLRLDGILVGEKYAPVHQDGATTFLPLNLEKEKKVAEAIGSIDPLDLPTELHFLEHIMDAAQFPLMRWDIDAEQGCRPFSCMSGSGSPLALLVTR
ncbi:NAD(P)H-quinone oxidoreductase subunit 5 [Striga asiatica]|uniref:NAD(P)H-quinone oxidoreductase subunit 5 n=1 Tax=Striga asiatica TaxID=4170 RepID=A0A5A7QFA4_STRAF|nr:NAD(P)H-quinone oxidoreductase subunit 5 [Striga asiatica]